MSVALTADTTGATAPASHGDDLARLVIEQDALLRVARAVASGAHPEVVFALVAQEVARIMCVEAGIVWQYCPEGSRVVGTHGEHGSQLGVVFPTTGEGAVAITARTGRPARVDYRAIPAADPTAARVVSQGYTGGVAAPLVINGRPWGAVLAATTGDESLPNDAESRLMHFAELASLAIANAQAREELTLRATIDDLTESINQGEFQRRIDGLVDDAIGGGAPLSLVVVDLDHFKRVNDDFGHQVGDRVLRSAARAMSGVIRPEGTLARVGGEEFAIILPGLDVDAAARVAERARHAGARMSEPGLPPVTASAGVADLADARSADQLFAAADRALYLAKESGRNRVMTVAAATAASGMAGGPDPAAVESPGPLAAVRALAVAVEAKDPATRRHSERVADLVGRMAASAGWAARDIDALRECALVHDVGKIGVPDALLLKRGPLSADEYEQVKAHAPIGAQIVRELLGPRQTAWVRHHHERHDGAGYPDGLGGDEIPAGARLLAVADANDVMTTGRSYAAARTPADAMAEVRAMAGTQFSPDAVRALGDALPG
ncbi:MAG: diguanylate cyclase [Miltoncostaeaceae bacterium]